jgi:hypothetical protein
MAVMPGGMSSPAGVAGRGGEDEKMSEDDEDDKSLRLHAL